MQFLVPCEGVNRLLSLNLETFDATEEFTGNGTFYGDVCPVWQHVNPTNLTAFEAALLGEEAYDVAATDLVLLALTYI